MGGQGGQMGGISFCAHRLLDVIQPVRHSLSSCLPFYLLRIDRP